MNIDYSEPAETIPPTSRYTSDHWLDLLLADIDVARRQTEDLLAQFKPAEQVNIVRGALTSLYNREDERRPSDVVP